MCTFLAQSTNMRKCTWLFVNSSQYKTPTSTSTESSKSCQDGADASKCAGTSLTNDCTAVQQMGCSQCRTDWSHNCDHLTTVLVQDVQQQSPQGQRVAKLPFRVAWSTLLQTDICRNVFQYKQAAKPVQMLFTVPRAS